MHSTARHNAHLAALTEAAGANMLGDLVRILGVAWAVLSLTVSFLTFQECPASICILAPQGDLEGLSITMIEEITTRIPLLPLRALLCTLRDSDSEGGSSDMLLALLCGATVSTPLLALFYFAGALWASIEAFAVAAERAEVR